MEQSNRDLAQARGAPVCAGKGMMATSRDKIEIRRRLVTVIGSRTASGEDVAAAARSACEDLAAVLVPLISEPGFEALLARAFHLAQREYPSDEAPRAGNGKDQSVDPFIAIARWLGRQDQRNAIDATAAVFAAVAALLAPLIGESLTTRYLQKAWPDGFVGAEGNEP
jgi:hypothetical protein